MESRKEFHDGNAHGPRCVWVLGFAGGSAPSPLGCGLSPYLHQNERKNSLMPGGQPASQAARWTPLGVTGRA